MFMRSAPVVLLALLGWACTPAAPYSYTASLPAEAKPADCEFQVASAPPESGYEEIGVLDANHSTFGAFVGGTASSDFRRKVAAPVCAAGGDLVVPHVDSAGLFVDATVYRLASTAGGTSEAAAPSP